MIIHSFGLVKKFIWVFHNMYGKSRTKCLANPVLNTVGNKIYWFSFSRDFMVHMRDNLHVTEINHCEKHRKGRLALFGERNQRRPPWEPPWFHENGASLIPWERGMERSKERERGMWRSPSSGCFHWGQDWHRHCYGSTVCSLSYPVLVICYFLAWTPSSRSMESSPLDC